MPRLSTPSATLNPPSDGDRVFADDRQRLWCAASSADATVFTCISDGRHSARAIAVDLPVLDRSVGDDILRAWLEAAPRIGTLP